MKDKLTKLNKKKTDAISVILSCQCKDTFYKWLSKRDPLTNGKIYSLKRLAKEFLGEFPGFYDIYSYNDEELKENIRIAQVCVYED